MYEFLIFKFGWVYLLAAWGVGGRSGVSGGRGVGDEEGKGTGEAGAVCVRAG